MNPSESFVLYGCQSHPVHLNAIMLIHLLNGLTTYFKRTSVGISKRISASTFTQIGAIAAFAARETCLASAMAPAVRVTATATSPGAACPKTQAGSFIVCCID